MLLSIVIGNDMEFIRRDSEWYAIEIRVCRAVFNLSQKQLADGAGLSTQSIKGLEKKGSNPKVETLMRIRHVFGEMGLKWNVKDDGRYELIMEEKLLEVANTGEMSSYVKKFFEEEGENPERES
jgi:transcriptional regulator with XRE-family HTH domain